MTEQEAVALLMKGDIAGLEVLMRLYQVRAVRAAYLITRDRAAAEDVVYAAFLHAYEHIHQFDSSRSFGPWFLRSVINRAIKNVARQKRHVRWHSDEAVVAFAELLEKDVLDDAETRREVWAALGQLSPQQRAVVVLRYYLDFTEAEIADELGCPPGTVKSRLHNAHRQLRRLLQPLLNPKSG
jgi:RNA polymerase sigma-70 factor, ECF subfamily